MNQGLAAARPFFLPAHYADKEVGKHVGGFLAVPPPASVEDFRRVTAGHWPATMARIMATRSRDDWVIEFIAELGELRPDLSTAVKYRHTLALHEWAAHRDMDPREAARQWASKPHAAP